MKNVFCILLFALFLNSTSAMAGQAGTSRFILGKVMATAADGSERRLVRTAAFYSGDAIDTGNRGRAQLQFEDGSFVSLQPATSFKVDDFQQGQTNNFAVSLARGGMRMVTGAIGKLEPRAVTIKTSVVTIGIRGTGFTLQICNDDCVAKEGGDKAPDGLYAFITDGRIILTNAGGELEAPKGRGVYVKDAQTAPVFTPVHPLALPVDVADQGVNPLAVDEATTADTLSLDAARISGNPNAKFDFVEIQAFENFAKGDPAPAFQAGEQLSVVPAGGLGIDVIFP